MNVWAEPLVKLRVPHIFNLRRDPFERADFNSNTYWDWMVDHVPAAVCGAGGGGAADRGVHQVPAASETGVVQPGRGDGDGGEAARLRRINDRRGRGWRALWSNRPMHGNIPCMGSFFCG